MYKWLVLGICIVLITACSKKTEVVEDIQTEETIEDDVLKEPEDKASDDVKVDEDKSENDEDKSEKKEDKSEKKEEVTLEENNEIEDVVVETSVLMEELLNDEWIQEESLYLSVDESFVVYKKWLDNIESKDFEVYIWDFESEPVLIDEASGFVQNIQMSPDEKLMIIHIGTRDVTRGLVYSIEENLILTVLESVDLSLWSKDSSKIIGRKIILTNENRTDVYNESLIYWDMTLTEPVEVMTALYGITFEEIRSEESDIKLEVVYPSGDVTDLMISYELLKNRSYPKLYSVDPYNYMRAMINSKNSMYSNSGYMYENYAIYWDTNNQTLSMWTADDGIIIIEEANGAYIDMKASPDNRYIAMTSGTSAARELLVVDSENKTIVYRTGPVYDSLYWSLDSQYLAFNILNDIIINPNLEFDVSLDIGLLYMEDLIGKRIAKGTNDHYLLVEGFKETGLDIYEADLEFQKTKGYTILNEDLVGSKEDFEDIDKKEETMTFLEFKFDNDYATKRVNDGIVKVDDFYIKEGYNTLIPEGYVPVSSTIDQYSIYDGFLSLFFTYTYRNEEGSERQLFDSLTYHTKDGILIDFDTMFKAEEIENVFSQMLIDEVANSDDELIKEFKGFTSEAKFYFVEDGIIVYYGDGVYTTQGQGLLVIKLLWDDLRGVIETDSLVY